jgi:VWFA-related protein
MPKWIVTFPLLAMIAAAQQSPPDPTFRTGTELVQISVVARDKDGQPVADLRREDFQIFDNGVQRNIALFLTAKPTPEPDAAALEGPPDMPAGVFTNQIATGATTGYSILLFDNLNVDSAMDVFTYTARAREKALKAIQAIPPGDRIAIYSLWCQFQVVREFTADRQLLLQQLGKFVPAPGNCVDSDGGPDHALTAREFNPAYAAARVPDSGAGIAQPIQLDIADQEMLQLAEHLAGIPGRKNLIWLTSTFRVKPSNLQKLLNANVAVYPVDTVGSTIGLPFEKKARYAPINALAAITGGKAYFDRDDLDAAIGDALSDGRFGYTLGFYRPEADGSALVHRIQIRTIHEGVVLRYRTSYSVEAPRLVSGTKPKEANPVQALVDALNRPVNATAISMMAAPTRSENKLHLTLTVDVLALDLQQKNGVWEGQTELVARFMTNDGRMAGKITSLTVNFHLRPATYAAALQRGYQLRREIEIPPKAADLNLLVGNLASGKIGTLTIPLSQVKSAAATEKK